jgi:trimethylamine:corrinoid methyltransferase-like protein
LIYLACVDESVVSLVRFIKASQRLSCRILSKESLDTIHYATLEVLEKTGVIVESDKEEAGCAVDYRKHLVIPPYLVKEALMRKPKNVTLSARNPMNDCVRVKMKCAVGTFKIRS